MQYKQDIKTTNEDQDKNELSKPCTNLKHKVDFNYTRIIYKKIAYKFHKTCSFIRIPGS